MAGKFNGIEISREATAPAADVLNFICVVRLALVGFTT